MPVRRHHGRGRPARRLAQGDLRGGRRAHHRLRQHPLARHGVCARITPAGSLDVVMDSGELDFPEKAAGAKPAFARDLDDRMSTGA